MHAYHSTASRRYERFVALEEAPGAYDEAIFSPPFQYDYLYCGSSLYGNLSASRMREWVAYHAHLFGPRSHFVFHDAGGVSPEVRAVLDPWIRAGRITVQDIRAQAEFDSYYYNQFLVVNDCLHRYRHAANWTFFFDVDEYLYLPNGQALDQVLGRLSGYTQFTIEQNPMSTKLCVKNPRNDYSRFVCDFYPVSRSNIFSNYFYICDCEISVTPPPKFSLRLVGNAICSTGLVAFPNRSIYFVSRTGVVLLIQTNRHSQSSYYLFICSLLNNWALCYLSSTFNS